MSNLGMQIQFIARIFVHMRDFVGQLLKWYDVNKREMPWRQNQNPYSVWLSEIILQQTRVAQGTPYFLRFLAQYPTVKDLALAPEDEVLKLWQGLGYYSRARNMRLAAQRIVAQFDGVFPKTQKELQELPGVGPYTASAIASICFDQVTAVVDGNVFRVLARYFDIHQPINQPQGIKLFQELAQSLISSHAPGTYNQAIMEFGSLQCTHRTPNCRSCPLVDGCLSFANKTVEQLPVKIKAKPARNRYFHYLVPLDKQQNTLLSRRESGDIWEGLYQFPLIEAGHALNEKELKRHVALPQWALRARWTAYNDKAIIHRLSHQVLHAHFWIIEDFEQSMPHSWDLVRSKGVPRLIERFLQKFGR